MPRSRKLIQHLRWPEPDAGQLDLGPGAPDDPYVVAWAWRVVLGDANVVGVAVVVWFGNRYVDVVESLVELSVALWFVERNPGSPDAAMPEPNV